MGQETGEENRKFHRRSVATLAHVEIWEPCVVLDVSETGARLNLGDTQALPEQFVIALTPDLRRWCRVKWRKNEELGVEFIAAPDWCQSSGNPL
jgi:hypothetical protein